jgi:hypothetical protein
MLLYKEGKQMIGIQQCQSIYVLWNSLPNFLCDQSSDRESSQPEPPRRGATTASAIG